MLINRVNFIFVQRLVFVFSLFISVAVQAGTSWQAQTSVTLEQLLKSNPENLPELNEPVVIDFYHERKYQPLWSNAKGRLNRAYDLLHALIEADTEGLQPADYLLNEIRKQWGAKQATESAHLDLLLSAALYRYSSDVHSGFSRPDEMDASWHIKNGALDIRGLLTDVASNDSITQLLNELPPRQLAYKLLKKQLQRYREFERQGGWQAFAPGPVLEAGVQHRQVVQLRRRLQQTGDLADCNVCSIDIFDHGLTEAVKRFQQRHGLTSDGRVGPETRKALNIPLADKIRQIRINMERWRWMPRTLGERYLMVNMTGFELNLIQDDSSILTMPVIIGKKYRATPSFSGQISYIVYNPYWTVPANMTVQDFVPKLINDSSLLKKKSIKLYRGWGANAQEIDPQTVDWSKLDKNSFPYWLRQEPGPQNALGRIKFLFSNPYEIYLHGTPDKHLFDRVVRTFSSGCIRVKDPVQLAAYLLDDGSLQMEEEILANIHLGSNQGVDLPVAVPIYLVYWTAWVGQQGEMNFRRDIYGRDTHLYSLFAY